MNKVLKFYQLNKGDSHLFNRTDQILQILHEKKTHLLVLNELNLDHNDQITKNYFDNYTMEEDNLGICDKRSRTGILIHKSIHYRRRRDLESQGTSTVWVELTYPGKKPLLVQGIYRQFQRLGVTNSETPAAQITRWNIILSKWEKAMTESKEIIVMGDINLNTLRWQVPVDQKTSYERSQTPMVEKFQEKILDQGFKILNCTPTRCKDTVDAKPACLDLILTNTLKKVASFSSGESSFSDHTIQGLHRTSKKLVTTEKYIRLRKFKNFKIAEFKDNILNHSMFIETLYEQESNIITKNIQTIIDDSLKEQAPVQILQLKTQYNNPISQAAKQALTDRDVAMANFKITNDPEDLRLYKNLKNAANKLISREKFNRNSNNLQEENTNSAEKWRRLKKLTGQTNFLTPQVIVEGPYHHTSHKDI